MLLYLVTLLPDFLLLPVVRNSRNMFTKRTLPQEAVRCVLPWTALSSPYSCVESHCYWGASFKLVFLRLEGGPQFISFQGAGVREGCYILWCQGAVVNRRITVSEKEPKGGGVAELRETRGRAVGRWHLPVWVLPGCCSPWGWSPWHFIWSLMRRVSTWPTHLGMKWSNCFSLYLWLARFCFFFSNLCVILWIFLVNHQHLKEFCFCLLHIRT